MIANIKTDENFCLTAELMNDLSNKDDTSELMAIIEMREDKLENVPLSVIENAVLLAYRTDVALKSTQTDKWVLLDKLAAEIYTPKSLRG